MSTVLIIAIGTRGDVAPFAALGTRLAQAGHHVAVATQAPFADLVTDAGLEYRELPLDPTAILATPEGRRTQRSGPLGLARMIRLVDAGLQEVGEGILAATRQGADALLLSPAAAPVGEHVAEGLRIPAVVGSVLPAHPSGDFPSLALSALVPRWGQRGLGRWGNLASHRVGAAGLQRMFRSTVQVLRARLDLGPPDRDAPPLPLLHGYSPTVLPRPSDWPAHVEIVGYWWPDRPPGWEPPDELVDFLGAGPPPVFFSFGSATPGNPAELAALATAALRGAGVRGVVQSGWAGLTATADDVLTIGSVPHDWLFPRMAALVHHCGAGTTAAGLRAGVPAVGVPVSLDQPFWASRLTTLGVSPGWIPAHRLTAPRLADAIRSAVDDPRYRQRARTVADRIATEDGGAAVVDRIGKILVGGR
jgi:UDP:flavonoid glycosyltransferase YjiC (YdhE family)